MKTKESKAGEKVLGFSKVDGKGRVGIPADAREEYGIKPGVGILFIKRPDGELALRQA